MSLLWVLVLGFYIVLNFILSWWIFKSQNLYYDPINIKHNGEDRNMHDLYPAFRRYDKKTSFIRIFLGINLLFWPRVILSILLCVGKWLVLK
jgi:hypothetical protein